MVAKELDEGYWKEPEPDCRASAPEAGLAEFARAEERLRHHVLFRTSGSSGTPRWVALSKEALRWSAERVNAHLGNGAEDCWGCALPTEHVGGYGVLARAAVAGGKVAFYPGKWIPGRFAEFCRAQRITVASLVPAQVFDLVDAGLECPPVMRVVVVGGGALPDELAGRARGLGWPVRLSYGMTETASQIATETASDSSMEGLPLIAPWEARVDAEGRISVRGGGLLSYYVIREKNAWSLERPVDAEGWFRTEDLGRITGPGRLLMDGRAGKVVKILGELVSLDRLDRLWQSVSADAGRLGVISVLPDPRRGFVVVLVTDAGDPERLQRGREVFDERVAPYERIQRILEIGEVPRTALGKVRHEEVRRKIAQQFG